MTLLSNNFYSPDTIFTILIKLHVSIWLMDHGFSIEEAVMSRNFAPLFRYIFALFGDFLLERLQ
jgi:hypothetical protein